MSESYSVKARLSAVDSGFSSTLKGALGVLDGFKSKLSGISFGVLSGIGSSLFSGITSGISDLVGEIDSSNASWKTFESNLSMLDWDSKSIDGAKKSLQDFAQQTVYNSSDMATTFAQLAAVGIDDTANLVQAFGGLAAAAENPKQAMKTLSQQATQMAAKPKVAWADFKLMMEQTPAGIAAVAREMGMTTSELVTAVQDGTVKTTDFFNAIKKAGGAGTDLAKLATEAKTVGQAMDGLKETLGNKLTPAFEYLTQIGIKAVDGISGALSKIDGEKIKEAIVGWVEDAKPMWESFMGAARKVWAILTAIGKEVAPLFASMKSSVGGAVQSILDNIRKINVHDLMDNIKSGFEKAQPYFDLVKNAISAVAGAIAKVLPYIQKVGSAIGSFFLDNSGVIAKFIPLAAGAIGAFKGFGKVKSVFSKASSGATAAASSFASGIQSILVGLSNVFKSVGTAADGIGKGLKSTFTGIGNALKLANPANILAIGAAIGVVVASFALLATQGEGMATILRGIGSVVESVGAAIGGIISTAIKAVAEALVILAPLMPIIAASLVTLTPLVTAFGQAFSLVAVAVGDAISKIVVALSEGIAIIVKALTPVVKIIADLVENIVSILVDGIVRIIEAIAPVLPAFTKAFTKVTEVVSNAIVSIIETLAPYIPEITKMVEATSTAIQAVCTAFKTLIEQVSPVIESVTLLIKQLGESLAQILGGASELVTAFGDTISQVVDSIGGAISGVLDSVAGIFESMGNAALKAGEGFEHLADGVKTITKLNLLDMATSLGTVASSIKKISKESKGITEAGDGLNDFAKALKSASKTGSKDLDSIGNAAKTAVQTMTTAFQSGATAAKTFGQQAGKGFATALKSGLTQATAAATAAISQVTAALNAGYSPAYNAGAFISIGFANGMLSQLATIRYAAEEMARQAQKALEAKAKIASPSKVTTEDGQWWGQGYADGILDKVRTVRKAAQELVSVPNVASPKLALAYGGELSTDYSYYGNTEYTIEVPLSVDGKEFAKATAQYTQSELDKRQARDRRKHGEM